MCGVLDQAIVLYLNDIYFSYESEMKMISQVMNLLVFSEPSQLLSSSCVLCSAPSISFSLADMINMFRLQCFSYCSWLSVGASHHAQCCMVSQPHSLFQFNSVILFLHFSFYLLHSLYLFCCICGNCEYVY